MSPLLQYIRTAILCAVVLAVGAGSIAAQDVTRGRTKKRAHRMFAAQTAPDEVTLVWDEVPGATEYRVYLPDPNAPGPPSPTTRPWTTGSGSSRRATVVGVRRMAAGAYLEAVAGRSVLFRGTFDPVTRAPLAHPSAPAGVSAAETGGEEVTVSWDAVPGATAYQVGRVVGGSGLHLVCDLCPAEPLFVDTAATPGVDHTYAVRAIFPLGHSEQTFSEPITVGAAQLAAAPVPTAAAWDKPMSTGTPVPGTEADPSNSGGGSVTPPTGGTIAPPTGAYTPPTGTITPPTGNSTVTCPPGTVPATTVPKAAVLPGSNKMMASGTPVGGTEADNTNAGASGGNGGTGAPTVACVPVSTGQPTGSGYTPPGTTTSTYTPPGTSTPTYTPPGTTAPAYTPPGQPAGTAPTYTPPGQPASTLPPTSQPVTATPAASSTPLDAIRVLVGRIQSNLAILANGVAAGAVTVHSATPVSSGTTSLTPIPATQASAMVAKVMESLTQLMGSVADRVAAGGTIPHAATPLAAIATAQPSSDPIEAMARSVLDGIRNVLDRALTVSTGVAQATNSLTTLTDNIRGDVTQLMGSFGIAASFASGAPGSGTTVHTATPISTATPPATSTPVTTPPAPATPAPASCRLDYQRADNMWAAFGRPDGQLGTESITLAPGQNRIFVTDWKYEKQRNDGTNYYGSHLRSATNPTGRPIRLQVRMGGVLSIRLEPNSTRQLAADLMEVICDY